MRITLFILTLIMNAGLIYVLDTRKVLPVPLGVLLSPHEGIWQNAEAMDADQGGDFRFPELKGKVEVYFDARLVPHVFAEQEQDAYFVQGFIHARHRLWQMEFQTHAAAGRISEIVGEKGIDYDRNQRRNGMVYAAENALHRMEADPDTKAACDAYTAGVNAYITRLNKGSLPVEYKILGYEPEKWTNLKSALFMKAMTNDLAGFDRDFEFTHALRTLGEENFRMLFPEVADSLSPVIPSGTPYETPQQALNIPKDLDSAYYGRQPATGIAENQFKPDPANGSNNWVIAGSRSRSGHPILCNDPHLRLSLPAIWYEMQLHTPVFNAYGATFPGIPGVVIGFNQDIAFGFTNAGRDVRDYYEVRFRDRARAEYWFDSAWRKADVRIEQIRVKGQTTVLDTVPYTVFGPVVYDASFPGKAGDGKAYALRWVAHDSANILKMWHLLNRARTHDDYLAAISHFNVPGQNMIFASRNGDIALWQQATFPLRWKDQGLFVMPGFDSSYMWQGYIPMEHNPHTFNPTEGYISSANQRPADSTYPYFIPGQYDVYRGIIINRKLAATYDATPDDMMKLQNDNYNVFAEYARPILIRHVDSAGLDDTGRYYLKIMGDWNLNNDPEQKGPTVFTAWWDSLQQVVYADDLNTTEKPVIRPERFVLLEALLRDTAYRFIDDIRTPATEDLRSMVTRAFRMAIPSIDSLEKKGRLSWARNKNTTVYHLLRNATMPFSRQGILNGGGTHIINATTHEHGPSWRMVVHMTTPIEAYAVYPGGQQGNPGSPFYDSFIDKWAKGEYYRIWFMTEGDKKSGRVKWRMSFSS
jgi:penicillin amidase